MDKRGNAAQHINLDDAPELAYSPRSQGLAAVADALQEIELIDPRKAQAVELKFFGGLSVEETAEVLRVSPQTVMRDWKMAPAIFKVSLRNRSTARDPPTCREQGMHTLRWVSEV
jgi:DNA-directed RNA polymerase specialized sigma subunit